MGGIRGISVVRPGAKLAETVFRPADFLKYLSTKTNLPGPLVRTLEEREAFPGLSIPTAQFATSASAREFIGSLKSTKAKLGWNRGRERFQFFLDTPTPAQISALSASALLHNAKVDPKEIKVVIHCGSHHQFSSPGDAAAIAHLIGSTATGFNVDAACAGIGAQVQSAVGMVRMMPREAKILCTGVSMLGSNALARLTEDPTQVVFGDLSYAMLVDGSGECLAIGNAALNEYSGAIGMPYKSHSTVNVVNLDQARELTAKVLPLAKRALENALADGLGEADTFGAVSPTLLLSSALADSPAVFLSQWALKDVRVGGPSRMKDLGLILSHQPFCGVLEEMAAEFGVDKKKTFSTFRRDGNISFCGVAAALHRAISIGKVRRGDLVGCAPFGAGMSCFSWVDKLTKEMVASVVPAKRDGLDDDEVGSGTKLNAAFDFDKGK